MRIVKLYFFADRRMFDKDSTFTMHDGQLILLRRVCMLAANNMRFIMFYRQHCQNATYLMAPNTVWNKHCTDYPVNLPPNLLITKPHDNSQAYLRCVQGRAGNGN